MKVCFKYQRKNVIAKDNIVEIVKKYNLENATEAIFNNHPFNLDFKDFKDVILEIDINAFYPTSIFYKEYPKIRIKMSSYNFLGNWKPSGEYRLSKENFNLAGYTSIIQHELGHFFDYYNPRFNNNSDLFEKRKILNKETEKEFLELWNYSIDYRLSKNKSPVFYSLMKNRKKDLQKYGENLIYVKRILEDNHNVDNLINLAKRIAKKGSEKNGFRKIK